mgnify:CR=1 FL=1|tara:strand:+ start:6 stop:1310 length:1305 start_codon:yes stop_codon:yes gene_type:complete
MYLKYTFIFILSIIFSADSIPLVESRNYNRAHKGDIKELAIKMKRKAWAGVKLDTLEVTKIYLSTRRNSDSYIEAYRIGSNKKEQFYFDEKGILSHGNSDRSIQVSDEISVYQMFNIILSADIIDNEVLAANTSEPDPKPQPPIPQPKPESKIVPEYSDSSVGWIREGHEEGEADIWVENNKVFMHFYIKDIKTLYKEAVVPPKAANSKEKDVYDFFVFNKIRNSDETTRIVTDNEMMSIFKNMIKERYPFMFRVIESKTDQDGLKLEINIETRDDLRAEYNDRFLSILTCAKRKDEGAKRVIDEDENWSGCIKFHAEKRMVSKNLTFEEAKKDYLSSYELYLDRIVLLMNEYFYNACGKNWSSDYTDVFGLYQDQNKKVMRTLILLANDNREIAYNRNEKTDDGSVVFHNNRFVPHVYAKATENLILFLPLEN